MSEGILRVGVVGTGALGSHHARVFAGLPDAKLVSVFDLDPVKAKSVGEPFGAETAGSLAELIDRIDAAVVAVPTVAHAEVAAKLLGAGRHVLVEKPITSTLEDAEALVALAAEKHVVLQVGHVERFNPAAEALQRIGTPRFVEVHRLSPFPNRSLDIDVILDLMIHDLDLLLALDKSKAVQIDAVGVPVLTDRVDIANVRIRFESGLIANLTASRVSAEKIRKFRVFGSRLYASCDFITRKAQVAKLVIGEGGAPEIRMEAIGSGTTDPESEPLRRQAKAFVGACAGRHAPVVSGADGLAVLRMAKEILDKMGGMGPTGQS
ncbi:MAG TPA: Gfo/Idh/MocA family oxidoreductase [Vicinamibacteria bacterium]|nr:Gfo/Idh/MocA family oxidoreductase [Vicinamibacteria bacterium]